MSYKEKLKHPKWQKKRLEILSRDGFACKICKDTEKTLHVHHKSYLYGSQPWEYEDNNFETLCEDCHNITEYYISSGVDVVKIIKSEASSQYIVLTEFSASIDKIINNNIETICMLFEDDLKQLFSHLFEQSINNDTKDRT